MKLETGKWKLENRNWKLENGNWKLAKKWSSNNHHSWMVADLIKNVGYG